MEADWKSGWKEWNLTNCMVWECSGHLLPPGGGARVLRPTQLRIERETETEAVRLFLTTENCVPDSLLNANTYPSKSVCVTLPSVYNQRALKQKGSCIISNYDVYSYFGRPEQTNPLFPTRVRNPERTTMASRMCGFHVGSWMSSHMEQGYFYLLTIPHTRP